MNWTSGPWHVAHRTVYALVDDPTWLDAEGKPRQVNRFSALIGGGGPYAAGIHEQEANGNLIAAAPELYDALERLLNVAYGEQYNAADDQMVRAAASLALAKARGEA